MQPRKPYQAKRPEWQSWRFWFWPIPLVSPLVKLGVTFLFGKAIGKWVIPATQSTQKPLKPWWSRMFGRFSKHYDSTDNSSEHIGDFLDYQQHREEVDQLLSHPRLEKHTLKTNDGAHLDLTVFKPIPSLLSTPPKKYIIYFCGNGSYYEDPAIRDNLIEEANKGHLVIGFNYRGVGKSTGTLDKANDLMIDGSTVLAALLNGDLTGQPVNPSQVYLKGHSMGGAVAVRCAADAHQQKFPVNVFASRTFDKLSRAAHGLFRKVVLRKDLKKTKPNAFLHGLIRGILSTARWQINVGSKYHQLTKGSGFYFNVEGDGIVVEEASLHRSSVLKKDRAEEKKGLGDEERKALVEIHNQRMMRLSDSDRTGRHGAPERKIFYVDQNENRVTAERLWCQFLNKQPIDHPGSKLDDTSSPAVSPLMRRDRKRK